MHLKGGAVATCFQCRVFVRGCACVCFVEDPK